MNRTLETTTTVLKYTFGFVFIIAGLDKVTNYMTTWTHYLWGYLCELSGLEPDNFMLVVGAVELIAGLTVLVRPIIGAYAILTWLILIAATLIASGEYFDVAVKDIVMAISVWCLALLTKEADSAEQRI